jgi:hypothetical protein
VDKAAGAFMSPTLRGVNQYLENFFAEIKLKTLGKSCREPGAESLRDLKYLMECGEDII